MQHDWTIGLRLRRGQTAAPLCCTASARGVFGVQYAQLWVDVVSLPRIALSLWVTLMFRGWSLRAGMHPVLQSKRSEWHT